MSPLQYTTIVSNPFQENTFVVSLESFEECLVVDPGLEPDKIFAVLAEQNLTPAAILITHGHSDHIGGNHAIKARWPECPLVVGHRDAAKLTDPLLNLSAQYGLAITSPPADQTVAEGDLIHFAGLELEVLEIPGHSPGHVVYVWRKGSPMVVLGGDVLFAGSIGRTDFEDGDFQQLADAIHTKLFTLPDDTLVLTGHGPATTIGEEKRANPFVGLPAGYAP
jgi:glyoxylase-like metal-dependent hydrolase (beta-lactamase superfamily II)